MAKIIKFPTTPKADPALEQLKGIADDIDSIVIEALENGAEPREIAGILSHRLGTLMRNIDEKTKLWDVCEQVLKRQAKIPS